MLIYWILLAFPAIATIATPSGQSVKPASQVLFLFIFWLFYNAISALRFNTGGDWYTYNIMVETIRVESLEFALKYGDVAFTFMMWVCTRIGLGIYGINALCSMLLAWGVLVMARRTPEPWLAVAASVPYLLIVVGFGYIRQGAAIGLILVAIANFTDRRPIQGVALVLLAMLFHVAAVVVLPVLGVALARRNWLSLAFVIGVGVLIFSYVLTGNRLATFQAGYMDRGYASSGALIRVVMNLLPSLLFLVRRSYFRLPPLESAIWTAMSVANVICFGWLLVSPSSTAVDRVALFFSPVQVFVFGYFLRAVQETGRIRAVLVVVGLTYDVAVQLVWLVFGANAERWVPYRTIFDRVQGL